MKKLRLQFYDEKMYKSLQRIHHALDEILNSPIPTV